MTAKLETPEKVAREMYWHELSDLQKLERMRRITKDLVNTVERLEASLYLLLQHSHDNEGHVMVNIHAMKVPVNTYRMAPEGEYF